MRTKFGRHELGLYLDDSATWLGKFVQISKDTDPFDGTICRVFSIGPVDFVWITWMNADMRKPVQS